MEFQNEVLQISGELAEFTAALLTPGSGTTRALQTIVEELDHLIDDAAPPRWLSLETNDGEMLVHLAEPMFTAVVCDADEYMDEAEDEFVYLDPHGEAFLRSAEDEYPVDRVGVDELAGYLCPSRDMITDFSWFGVAPDLFVFEMIMEDASEAVRGALPAYLRAR